MLWTSEPRSTATTPTPPREARGSRPGGCAASGNRRGRSPSAGTMWPNDHVGADGSGPRGRRGCREAREGRTGAGQRALEPACKHPFGRDESEAWWFAFDLLSSVDEEMRQVDSFLQDVGRETFAINGVVGAGDPGRFRESVETDGWEPVDAQLIVSDVTALVRKLGGSNLYGKTLSFRCARRLEWPRRGPSDEPSTLAGRAVPSSSP